MKHVKKTILSFILLMSFVVTNAQNPDRFNPSFPGGNDSLLLFVYSNLQYPDSAYIKELSGKVICAVDVDESGNILNPKIIKTSNEIFNSEALRIVEAMPKWIAAEENGLPIKKQAYIPINFDFKMEKNRIYPITSVDSELQTLDKKNSLDAYIYRNIRYPEEAMHNFQTGSGVISFVVTQEGVLQDLKIEHSAGKIFDEEVLRVYSKVDKVIPATKNGRNVKVLIYKPFIFYIGEDEDLKDLPDNTIRVVGTIRRTIIQITSPQQKRTMIVR